MSEHSPREVCPECGSEETEFVQFASGEENTVETEPEEVGDGLLELRCCDGCGAAIEVVLTAESHKTIPYDPNT